MMIPAAPAAGTGAFRENLESFSGVLTEGRDRPPANPLVFRGKRGAAPEFGSSRLTWTREGSKMVVGASARRPLVPEPRAAQTHSSVSIQGRVAGAVSPARPEVNRGRRAENHPATQARSRDLRPRAPRPEGGLLITALRSPAPVAPP